MIIFDNKDLTVDRVLETTENRAPDFSRFMKVLEKKKPSRPVLFEFFMNNDIYSLLLDKKIEPEKLSFTDIAKMNMTAFRNAGYDYFTLQAPFSFPSKEHRAEKSISLNETVSITDKKSFDSYAWPDVCEIDFSYLQKIGASIPKGMKAMPNGPGGVLENVTALLGFEKMCLLLYDDPILVSDVFDKVGSILLEYYMKVSADPSVGVVMVNDDWGFKTQTMLKTEDMQKYVIPWHKRIVEHIHSVGKPAILHSCGNLANLYDDIIFNIGYDAKHSYEDTIMPVEEFYKRHAGEIAVLGGIDLDFVCTSEPVEIFERSRRMLELSSEKGGYALGTGNSVPAYVPPNNYFAMILAALLYD